MRRRPASLLIVAVIALVALPITGRAATTILVHPGDLAGWSSTNTAGATGSFVEGPGAPPTGSGSFRQTALASADRQVLRSSVYNGTPLASISRLTYRTYVTSFVDGQATAINLRVDTDGNGTTDDTLSFEPVYQTGTYATVPGAGPIPAQCPPASSCAVEGTWQLWNARDGGWWTASAMTAGPPLDTLAHYESVHPGTRLATDQASFLLAAGSGWTGFDGAVDLPTIGVGGVDTSYDFERGPSEIVIVYPFDMRHWTTVSEGSGAGSFLAGPGSVPSGLGSFRQRTPFANDRQFLQTDLLDMRKLTDIHALGYSTFVTANNGGQATTMQLLVDLNGDGIHQVGTDDTLTFEPAYQNGGFPMVSGAGPVPDQCGGSCVPIGTWKTWDADAGGWWSRLAGTSGPPLDTLSHYSATHPGAAIISLLDDGLKLASGSSDGSWAGFNGSVDAVRVDSFVYDMEPTSFDVDCDTTSDDIDAIQSAIDLAPNGMTIGLKGTCDFTAAPAHGGDITSITNTAVLIRPGIPVDGLTIRSSGAPQSATILGSGEETAFVIGPDNDGVTITGLRFMNLARPIVAINTDQTTVGVAGGPVPNPAANRIIGNATMDSAVLGLAVDRMPANATPGAIFVAFGANGSSTQTWINQSGATLTGFKVLGNYITYDPPGVPDGSSKGTVAIDVRQRYERVVDGVTVQGNAVGMFESEFPSTNMNAVLFHSLTPLTTPVTGSVNDYYIRNVAATGNNLGKLEELPDPITDIHAAGRVGIYLIGVGGFQVNGNSVRARGSATGLPMPHGGIVTSDSGFGNINGNAVNVIADPSTVDSGLGAIGVVDEIGAIFNGAAKPQPSTAILVENNILGTSDPDTTGINQRGIVVNGSSLITARSNTSEITTEDAINIGVLVQGPGDLGNPGPVDLPRTVTASTFCGNTLDGTLDDPNEVSFGGGAASTANNFPGGEAYAGNAGCAATAIVVEHSGGTTVVAEGGATDIYTVRLPYRPESNVTVTTNPDTQVTTSPASVTFTPFNWHVPQPVTVAAVDDAVAEGGHFGVIAHSVTSADASYNGLPAASVTASIIDNDTSSVIITPSTVSVAEGGATGMYNVVLGAQPPANVTITAVSNAQVNTAPASVTFTPLTWNVPQPITVSAVDDTIREGAHTTVITHTSSSTSAPWNGMPVPSVLVQIADNDAPNPPVITYPPQNQQLNNGNVTVTGTAEPGALVEVFEGPLLGSTTANVYGQWALRLSFSAGSHTITARQTTVDLLVSAMSPGRTFIIDLTPPGTPVITSPANGATLTTCPVVVSGTADPGSIVVVSNNGMPLTSTVAGPSGTWSVTLPCAAGTFNVTAVAYDTAGNVSPASATVTFTLVLPAPPTIITPAQNSLQPTPTFVSGTGIANELVRLYEGNNPLGGHIPVDGSGSWQIMQPFSEGTHTIQARSVVGNTSGDPSAPRTFSVDANPPAVHITRPSGYLIAQIVLPSETVTVSGTATDRIGVDRIVVTYTPVLPGLGTEVTHTATCTGCPGTNVTWTDTPDLALGLYEVVVIAYDGVGNSSPSDSILLLNLNP
jgi:Big-like domain-containing protein